MSRLSKQLASDAEAVAVATSALPARPDELSPLQQARRVHTPTLLLQGDDDRRCPLGQSEELFAALVRQSEAPCRMVVYPGGTHSLAANGKPSHRLDYHQRIVDWVREHTAS